jgi:serine phosphatase RsbU (regulator of sigma subunit)
VPPPGKHFSETNNNSVAIQLTYAIARVLLAGDAKELRARGMPLGLMSSMGFEEMEIVLEAGDRVLFYSDGLVEAHDPKGEMFGFPRLRALIAERGEERSLVDLLMEELYSFTGEGWEQEDDITNGTLERRTSPPSTVTVLGVAS